MICFPRDPHTSDRRQSGRRDAAWRGVAGVRGKCQRCSPTLCTYRRAREKRAQTHFAVRQERERGDEKKKEPCIANFKRIVGRVPLCPISFKILDVWRVEPRAAARVESGSGAPGLRRVALVIIVRLGCSLCSGPTRPFQRASCLRVSAKMVPKKKRLARPTDRAGLLRERLGF